jgi:hypothetical protein
VLLYRVFPHVAGAGRTDRPGHPLYVHPTQGQGRWDNPSLYLVRYLATSPEAAVGEAFGGLHTWTPAMLAFPAIAGAERRLATYRFDEEANPLLDLDDARALVTRNLRPTDIVRRNRPRTQSIAAAIHNERTWSGISWWSYQRPQWTVVGLWQPDALKVESVADLPGHPAILDAALTLAKPRIGI